MYVLPRDVGKSGPNARCPKALLRRDYSCPDFGASSAAAYEGGLLRYLFHILERGRWHVRVPPKLGRPRRRQARSQRPVPVAGATVVPSDLHVGMPPLQRVRNRHVQQAVRRVLREHRLQYRRALLLAPANATAPRVLETRTKLWPANVITANYGNGARCRVRIFERNSRQTRSTGSDQRAGVSFLVVLRNSSLLNKRFAFEKSILPANYE